MYVYLCNIYIYHRKKGFIFFKQEKNDHFFILFLQENVMDLEYKKIIHYHQIFVNFL